MWCVLRSFPSFLLSECAGHVGRADVQKRVKRKTGNIIQNNVVSNQDGGQDGTRKKDGEEGEKISR